MMVRHLSDIDLDAQARRTEIIALVLVAGWLISLGAVFIALRVSLVQSGFSLLGYVMLVLAVLLPVALILVAGMAVRNARKAQIENQALQTEIETLQHQVSLARHASKIAPPASVERKMTKIAQAKPKGDAKIATFSSKRDLSQTVAAPTPTMDQPTLGFDPQPEDTAPPLSRADLICALNFPDTESDTEGFAALRRALQDRTARQLVQASQDVLTLLSQDGIYMDDLASDLSRPELWRRFAQGERGRAIGALGGVRDRTSLALTTSRMREDPIFRDAAHHFLRNFDKMLTSFEVIATDTELVALSDTRTARAFMLLGRVSGAFD